MRDARRAEGRRLKVLITGPARNDPGGVANYYNAVLPHLERGSWDIEYLEIGRRSQHSTIRQVLKDQLVMLRRIDTWHPDIVHINPSLNRKSFFRDAMFAFNAARKGARLVVFVRGWEDRFAEHVDRWLGWVFRWTFGRAAAFVVLANSVERRIRQWGFRGTIHLDTTVVPDDLLEGFSLDRKFDEMTDPSVRVLFLARLESEKGVLETIDAVVALARQGYPVTLTIAGDGSAIEQVRERLLDRTAAHCVRLAGYVSGPQKAKLLASHHVYCLPSYHGEGMPNSLLEAMAFGMPVVTCAVGGIVDMFIDGRMGFLVPPKDPQALAGHLRNLIENRVLLLEMARFNHQVARTRFLASLAAERLVAVYSKATSTTLIRDAVST